MALRVYLGHKFEYPHEQRAFDRLYTELQKTVGQTDDLWVMLGNFTCQGSEIDLLVVHPSAIVVIDFKNHGGEIIGGESGTWRARTPDGLVKIGQFRAKNPFEQVKGYRSNLWDFLKENRSEFLSNRRSGVCNFSHITAMLVFLGDGEFEYDYERNHIPERTRYWFRVVHINDCVRVLNALNSRELYLTESEIRALIRLLSFDDDDLYQLAEAQEAEASPGHPTLPPVLERHKVKPLPDGEAAKMEVILWYYTACLEEEDHKTLALSTRGWKEPIKPGDKKSRAFYRDLFDIGAMEVFFSANLSEIEIPVHLHPQLQAFFEDNTNKKETPEGDINLYYGYPVAVVNKRQERKGKIVFSEHVVPLFYTHLDVASMIPEHGVYTLKRDHIGAIEFNYHLLRRYGLEIEEGKQIKKEEIDNIPSFAEKVKHVYEELSKLKGKAWNMPPSSAVESLPISKQEERIYSHPILFYSERSPYTVQLLSELNKLRQPFLKPRVLRTPVRWLFDAKAFKEDVHVARIASPSVAIRPMNNSQVQSVQTGLTSKLTVITGPPGTGKTDVVINLIGNAFRQGQSVLFASKNNRAVDEVCNRLRSDISRDFIVRTGNKKIMEGQAIPALEALLKDIEGAAEVIDLRLMEKQLEDLNFDIDQLRQRLIELSQTEEEIEAVERDIQNRSTSLPKVWQDVVGLSELDLGVNLETLKTYVDRTKRLWEGKELSLLERLIRRILPNHYVAKYAKVQRELISGIPDLLQDAFKAAGLAEQTLLALHDNFVILYVLQVIEHQQARLRLQCHILEKLKAEYGSAQDIEAKIRELTAKKMELSIKLIRQSWSNLKAVELAKNKVHLAGFMISIKTLMSSGMIPAYGAFMKAFEDSMKMLLPLIRVWAVTNLSPKNSYPLVEGLFDLLIIDEAVQCDIASAIPLFYRAKRVVVLGDPNQLRHISAVELEEDLRIAERSGVGALFQTIGYAQTSLYDFAEGVIQTQGYEPIFLNEHYRSDPRIIEFSNQRFYGSRLRVRTPEDRLIQPVGELQRGIRWVDIVGRVEQGWKRNIEEAEEVKALLKRLVALTDPKKVSFGIVTPFRDQHMLLEGKLKHEGKRLMNVNIEFKDAEAEFVGTAHKFQGDQRDIMIMSMVVSDGAKKASGKFINDVAPQLLNVAITRARSAIYIVGNKTYCRQQGGLLKELVDAADMRVLR